jgi:predicted nucleic acid-binding protein
MNKYLLDTNVVSELPKPRLQGGVVAWLNHQEEDQLFLSAVTMGEFQAGIERTRRRDPSMASDVEFWADQLAALCQILPMDTPCFREWGRIMARKPDRSLEHAMMAPTARNHQLIVVTRNEADFRQLDVRILNPFRRAGFADVGDSRIGGAWLSKFRRENCCIPPWHSLKVSRAKVSLRRARI